MMPLLAAVLPWGCGRSPDGADGGAAADTGATHADGALDGGASLQGLRIATWNLEHFPKTAMTPARLQEVLEEQQIDLLGIEEVADDGAFAEFIDGLTGYAGHLATEGDGFIKNAFIYRRDRITVQDVRTLFTDEHYAFPRPPLGAHVASTVDGADFDFLFMVVHLKAGIDGESRDRRRAAIEYLDMWVGDILASSTEKDLVIVGDFNDELTDNADENIFQSMLSQPDRYRFLTRGAADADEHSYLAYQQMIDHILITTDASMEYGSGQTEVVHLDETIPGYRNQVSDHRPVISRFGGQE